MKASATACANIALVKYWGNRDNARNVPAAGSVSFNLDSAVTTTTVEFSKDQKSDEILVGGRKHSGIKADRSLALLETIRKTAKITEKARVVSENNFPTGAGIASSASGAAALAVAASAAAGLNLPEKALSQLARSISVSGSRSVPEGFVENIATDDSYSISIAPPGHWPLVDLVAVVSEHEKKVSSSEGHLLAQSSPFFNARIANVPKNIADVKNAVAKKDFPLLAAAAERDSISMHSVMMTSVPPIYYWEPGTMGIIRAVEDWRAEGIKAFHTIDAGPSVHVITLPEFEKEVTKRLMDSGFCSRVISCRPGPAAKKVSKHLF
jgi:diphosphomevalonate decarboxylase